MEVKIQYKQKSKSEKSSKCDVQPVAKSDQEDGDEMDKDKLTIRMYQLTQQQLSDLKDAFGHYDRSGSGFIAAHDLGNVLRIMGQTPTESDIQDMLQEAALEENGKMKLEELLRLVSNRGLQSDAEIRHALEDAFRFFDKDGRGFLKSEDLRSALQSYGEPLDENDLVEMMKMADNRGDGRVNYFEFMRKTTSK